MNLVAFILTFIGVSYAFEDQCRGAHLKSVHVKCILANGGDRVVIEDLVQLKEADDKNGKCFRDCLMRECKYFGDNGKLNPDVPKRLAWLLNAGNESNGKAIEEAIAKCMDSQTYGDSKCNNSEVFVRCLIQQWRNKLTTKSNR